MKNSTVNNFDEVRGNISTKEINSLLSSGKGNEAYVALNPHLDNCGNTEFVSNCVNWMQVCCSVSSPNDDSDAKLGLFAKLIKLSARFPELIRPISSTVGPRFCDFFFKSQLNTKKGWTALEALMYHYSGSLYQHKSSLEAMMTSSFLSTACPLYQARCWALIPSLGSGGINNTQLKTNWTTQMDQLIAYSHHILNHMFKDIVEFSTYHSDEDSNFKLPLDSSYHDLAEFLSNICSIIHCMLMGRFPVPKCVPAGKIMELINRILLVNTTSLGKKSISRIILLENELDTVHVAALKVLNGLIVCAGRTLLPVTNNVTQVLVLAVQAARASPQRRLHVCSAVSNWIAAAGPGCNLESCVKELVAILLNDIEPKQQIVKLKDKSKDIKGQSYQLTSLETCDALRIASLRTISLLITAVGFKLEATIHKTIQTCVVRQLCVRDKGILINSEYRAALYLLLQQLCLEPGINWPPPTQFALKLFRQGIQDTNPHVASACAASISILEKIIHPEFSVASFPTQHSKTQEMRTSQQSFIPDNNIPIGVTPNTTETNPYEEAEISQLDFEVGKENVGLVSDETLGTSQHSIDAEKRVINEETTLPAAQELEIIKQSNSDGNKKDSPDYGKIVINIEDKEEISILSDSSSEHSCIIEANYETQISRHTQSSKIISEPKMKRRKLMDEGAVSTTVQSITLNEATMVYETQISRHTQSSKIISEPKVKRRKLMDESAVSTTVQSITLNEATMVYASDSEDIQMIDAHDSTRSMKTGQTTDGDLEQIKKNQESKLGEQGKGTRSKGSNVDDIDIHSPMSLRSGTMLSSSSGESRRRHRDRDDASSISSQSIPSSPSSVNPDPDAILDSFDDTPQAAIQ